MECVPHHISTGNYVVERENDTNASILHDLPSQWEVRQSRGVYAIPVCANLIKHITKILFFWEETHKRLLASVLVALTTDLDSIGIGVWRWRPVGIVGIRGRTGGRIIVWRWRHTRPTCGSRRRNHLLVLELFNIPGWHRIWRSWGTWLWLWLRWRYIWVPKVAHLRWGHNWDRYWWHALTWLWLPSPSPSTLLMEEGTDLF